MEDYLQILKDCYRENLSIKTLCEQNDDIHCFLDRVLGLLMHLHYQVETHSVAVIEYTLKNLSSSERDGRYLMTPEEIFDVIQTVPIFLAEQICKRARKYNKLLSSMHNRDLFCSIIDEEDNLPEISKICYYYKFHDDIEQAVNLGQRPDFGKITSYDPSAFRALKNVWTDFSTDNMDDEKMFFYFAIYVIRYLILKENRLLMSEENNAYMALFEHKDMQKLYDFCVFLNNQYLQETDFSKKTPFWNGKFAIPQDNELINLVKEEKTSETADNPTNSRKYNLGILLSEKLTKDMVECMYNAFYCKLASEEDLDHSTTSKDFLCCFGTDENIEEIPRIYWHGTTLELSWFLKYVLPPKKDNFWNIAANVFWVYNDAKSKQIWIHVAPTTIRNKSNSLFLKKRIEIQLLKSLRKTLISNCPAVMKVLPPTDCREAGKKVGKKQ